MKKGILIMLLASFVLTFAGCGEDKEVSKYVERQSNETLKIKGTGFVKVASGKEMELYIDTATDTIRWKNIKTGEYQDTKIFDDEVSAELNKKSLSNDISLEFFTGTESARYKSFEEMGTYEFSVLKKEESANSVTYEKIDKGVRIVYVVGNNAVTYKDFPTIISAERFEKLVASHCDSKTLKTLKKQYRELQDGTWIRSTNKDNPLAGLAADALYKIFYVDGEYTYEDLEYDNTMYDKLEDMPQRKKFTIAVDYSLDGDDLVVHIDTATIEANDDFPLRNIKFLPYFFATKEEGGYLFIPDGSGAILDLDSKKTKETAFSMRYLGGDIINDSMAFTTIKGSLNAPVYGIYKEGHAMLGIIEEGAQAATLITNLKGSMEKNPYGNAYLSFAIREDKLVQNFSSAMENFTLKKENLDYFGGNITVRYKFLTGEEANYSGMARAYKKYLVDREMLAKNEAEENAPLFVEFVGCVDSKEYFLGIPYDGTRTITTFDEAKKVLEDLNNSGVKNVIVDYVGLANGGMLQRACTSVDIESQLGGKSGLKKLNNYAESIGYKIFPDFQLQTVNTDKGLSKNKKAFDISGTVAQIYEFDTVTREIDKENKYPTYIVSPTYIEKYIDKFSKSYSKLKIKNLASEDFYTFIAQTYKKGENVSMATAAKAYDNSLMLLAGKYDLMLKNPVYKGWEVASYVDDIPYTGTEMRVLDTYIPFTEMVLSGNITYSNENINKNSYDMRNEFLKTMEYGSALKFRIIGTKTKNLYDTKASNIFLAEYDEISDQIKEMYKEYEEYYKYVKGATLTNHELIVKDGSVVKTTWSNGVTMYFNYSDTSFETDGILIKPMEYYIRKGR